MDDIGRAFRIRPEHLKYEFRTYCLTKRPKRYTIQVWYKALPDKATEEVHNTSLVKSNVSVFPDKANMTDFNL